MSSEQVKHAIQLIKAGQSNEARLILLEEVRRDPEQENAWLWLATTMPSDAQRVSILKECLKYNPDSEMAQKSLEALSSRLIEPTFKQSDEIRSAPEKTPEKISPAAPVPPASRPVNEPVRRRRPQKQSGSCLGLILMFLLGLLIGAVGFWAVERFILPPNTLDPKNTIPPVSTPIPQASPTSTVDPSTPTPTAVALPADSGLKLVYLNEGTLYSINQTGLIVDIAKNVSFAQIAPDGSRVLYVNDTEIRSANLDGSDSKVLVTQGSLQQIMNEPGCQLMEPRWIAGQNTVAVPCLVPASSGAGLDLKGIVLINPTDGSKLATYPINAPAARLVYSNDGQLVAIASSTGDITALNLTDGSQQIFSLAQLNPKDIPAYATWGAIAWNSENTQINLLIYSDPYATVPAINNPGINSGDFSQSYILLQATLDGRLRITGHLPEWPDVGALNSSTLFSPDGRSAMYPTRVGLTYLDLDTGTHTAVSLPGGLSGKPVAWTPDSSTTLITAEDGHNFSYTRGSEAVAVGSEQKFISQAAWLNDRFAIFLSEKLYSFRPGSQPELLIDQRANAYEYWLPAFAKPMSVKNLTLPVPTPATVAENKSASVLVNSVAGLQRITTTGQPEVAIKGSLSRIVLTSDGELAAFIADQKLQIAKTANSATPITVNAAPDNTMVPDYPAPLSPFVGAYAWQTGPTTLIVEYKNSVVDTETIIGYAFINPETGERKSFQVYAQTGNSVFAPSGRAALVNNYKSHEPSLTMVNLSTNKNYFDLIKLPNPQMGDTPVYVPPLIHWAQNGSQAFVAFFEPATTDSRDPCLTNCKVVLYSISTSGEVNRLGNLPASYENDEFPVISFSGSGQWVAYTVGIETHIYDPAKREDRLVLPEPAAEISWAAGSERFAVISTSGNGYIIGTDGKTESFGRSGETIGTLNWADSNTLVYLQSDNGRWDIFVKNIGETPMLIFNQLGKYFPAQLFALPAQ